MTATNPALAALRRHVTGRIESGDAVAVVEIPTPPARHPRPDPAQLDRVPPDSDRERAAWAAWLAYTERRAHPSVL